MALIESLGYLQGATSRQTKAAVGFSLETGQIIKQWGKLFARLTFLGDGAWLMEAAVMNGLGCLFAPDAFGLEVRVFFPVLLFETLVKPATRIGTGFCLEGGMQLPIIPGLELFNFLFAVHQDGQGRGLNPSNGRQVKPSRLGVEGRHGPCPIDADQPV